MNETKETDGQAAQRATAVIRNSAGIHCRPTAVIVKAARQFDGPVTVHTPAGGSADVRSAIELLSLALEAGSTVEIEAGGSDAAACLQRMVELFETEFDFPRAP